MSKAKLSQIATTWMDEEDNLKKEGGKQEKKPENMGTKKQFKKKQTFNLRVDTIKCLWMHRVRTEKTLSEIMDDLVLTHLPGVDLEETYIKKEENKTRS